MIIHYSSNIKKLIISYDQPSLLTIVGYHHVALLHLNLLELSMNHCLKGGMCVISDVMVNLTSLSLSNSRSISSEDLDSLSKLTNLEKINLGKINLDDAAVVNYSTLTKMRSIEVSWCRGLSGLGLSDLVANKQFLVQLKIQINCCHDEISFEGYHCLTTLTNLIHFTIYNSRLDDIGLNMICSSCLFIEYLDIRLNRRITIEGLNNIHRLTHLKSLSINVVGDDWLSKLCNNTTLTDLDLSYSYYISNEGLSRLSSLVNLSKLDLNGCWNIDHNLVSQIFAFPISIFFEDDQEDPDDEENDE
jgi:hypothetical protein